MIKKREVDIRLYDTASKSYIDTTDLKISSIRDDNYITQLYTGCKDKEGIKIFEGDIVECRNPLFTSPKRLEIKWSHSQHCFNIPSAELRKHITVVGNVLEEQIK